MDTHTLKHELRTYQTDNSEIEDFPATFIWPRYDGLSVGNLAATAAHLLGATLPGTLPPLRENLLAGLTEGVRRVVIVVMDALGWEQLQWAMAAEGGEGLIFHRLAKQGRLLPITTVFPSTTNNVLSTIWTGQPPIRHGLLAYELYLREWGMAVESISFSPFFRPFKADLESWGFEAPDFLPVPSLAQLLSVQGILSYTVAPKHIVGSSLSQMHNRGVRDISGYVTASDFWGSLRRTLREHRDERIVVAGYWSAVDTLGHNYGPRDETGIDEIRSIAMLMDALFFEQLEPADCKDTLLLLVADHGQIGTPPESAILLTDHPLLRECLFMPPLGESRVPFFYVRAGKYETAWAYLNRHFPEQFVFWPQETVIRSGLLGPGTPYTEVRHRLGDIVGVARGDAFIACNEDDVTRLLGRHGGLTPEEMLVPLLAVRLD